MTTYIIYTLYLIIALQFLDGHSTYIAIKAGYGAEANGLMARVFSKLGLVPGLLAVKSVTVAALYWLTTQFPTMIQSITHGEVQFIFAAFAALAVFYAVVVTNNYRIYFTGKNRA